MVTAPKLEAVCRVAEFKEFRLRAGEKNVNFPSTSKMSSLIVVLGLK